MEIAEKVSSRDGITVKYLQKLHDGFFVETTYVNRPEKHIVCFSSQVGCAVGCSFCASGLRLGSARFRRSLSADELITQCVNVIDDVRINTTAKRLLFSCSGEGEPFFNFDATVDGLRELGNRFNGVRLAVSTSGVRPDLIERLADEPMPAPLKLQISLHASDNKLRRSIIPVCQPIEWIVAAGKSYVARSGRALEWNYVLMAGVNDSIDMAYQLAALLGPRQYVKFNRLNPIASIEIKASERERAELFGHILKDAGLIVESYETDGCDIWAACGQLAYRAPKTGHVGS